MHGYVKFLVVRKKTKEGFYKKRKDEMNEKEKWFLLQRAPSKKAYWVTEGREPFDNNFWEDAGGITFPKRDDDIVHGECEVEDYEDLDHSKTGLLQDASEASGGWVDRDGKFYGCEYMAHDDLARLVIRKEVKELEQLGWIRVWKMPDVELPDWDYHYTCRIRMTASQRNTVSRMGFALKDDD